MAFQPFRHALALPRVRPAMLLVFLARLPVAAVSVTLTLHVVTDLGRGYGAAGLVCAAMTLGSAVGAPMLGRAVDRYGLRPVVAVCGTCSTAYWLAAPDLPYPALVAITLPACALSVPAGSMARQVLAALVPAQHRRAAYSLDSISVEVSFMVGPPLAILAFTQVSPRAALSSIGVCFGLVAVLFFTADPPVRAEHEDVTSARPPLRSWMSRRLLTTLLVGAGATFTLIGMELASLAALRASGDVGWAGLVIISMCVASLSGGVVHGAVHRSLPQPVLMTLMAALTLPVALFARPWWLLLLAVMPLNVLCAPTLAATTETVSHITPPRVRGEAMGLLDCATRLGLAVGNPAVGLAIDHGSPSWGFVAAGAGGLVMALLGLARPWQRRRRARSMASPTAAAR